MNEALKRLESFEKSWREPLQSCAQVAFHYRAREHTMGAPARVADDFVARCGYKSIGFHWELLDPLAERTGDRSALGAFEDALAKDLAMRTSWLGSDRALECGREFLAAFEPPHLTLVTNHIVRAAGQSEAWTPISNATFEWAFVGFDDAIIALLLLTAED
ncbi:MAG: hypothetical protein AAFQ90_06310 [Pseudomonadota bacterium]